jgi:hypothetical protein
MRQYYPESKVLTNTFVQKDKFYYVYKITLTPSGHFYIGYTGDISSRLSQHIHGIGSSKYKDLSECNEFYRVAAELFGKEHDDYLEHLKIIRKGISVLAIAICMEPAHAKAIEKMAIQENSCNPLCLNSIGRKR